jgi:FkbM family methyltransferase
LAADARRRLAEFAGGGRLEIYNVAIAPHRGQVDFFASGQSLWGSISPHSAEMNQRLGTKTQKQTVPSLPFGDILERHGVPYYLKVDIEGSDALCLQTLVDRRRTPRFVSVECDLNDRQAMFATVAALWSLGYREFKLLNQALNPTLRCPQPALEGQFVDAAFTKSMSGPFGDETPGRWLSADQVWDSYAAIARQQRLRTTYAATGRVWGIPLGRFQRQLSWLYNTSLVTAARQAYARLRRTEVGGWFDLHARYCED